MPFKSIAQQRYFNANKSELQKAGVDVNEWNDASNGARLPLKATSKVHNKTMKSNTIKLMTKALMT